MRTVQAVYLGPREADDPAQFRLDDGRTLPWYHPTARPWSLVPGQRYTVATDGRKVYPALIV
jgi:hypothetical protein